MNNDDDCSKCLGVSGSIVIGGLVGVEIASKIATSTAALTGGFFAGGGAVCCFFTVAMIACSGKEKERKVVTVQPASDETQSLYPSSLKKPETC